MVLLLLFILSVLGTALSYAAWNMLRKQELMETFIVNAQDNAVRTLAHMRALDAMQMFELDDDVGQIFKELVADIEQYAVFLGMESPLDQPNATEAQSRL